VALTVAAVLSACDSGGSGERRADDDDTELSTSTTTSADMTPTTAGAASPEAVVLDAYRRYWTTVNTYGAELAPFDPGLFKQTFSPVATGPQYDTLFNLFQLNRLKGWVYRGRETGQFRPDVIELSADRAVVEDCADDFGGIFDTKNNEFVEPLTPGQHTRISAVLRYVDGAWKVHTQGGGDERCDVPSS
jgi:hypothetical protein